MWEWIKKNYLLLIAASVLIGLLVYGYGCEPKTASLVNDTKLVNRQELQLELDQFIGLAQLRMVDLDRQEELRAVILQNALILVQGQPFNPVGLITMAFGVFGVEQTISKTVQGVKNAKRKRKVNNGVT